MSARSPSRIALTPAVALALGAALLGACGGPRRLVVELGAPVELTAERSTGFDPELTEDNGKATFAGERLASPTGFGGYEGIDVLAAGKRLFTLDAPLWAGLMLLDGAVVELRFYGEGHADAATIEAAGREMTARFDSWRDRDPAYWPYIVRDLRAGATNVVESGGSILPAGTFVHESGIKATIRARYIVSPSGTTYRLELKMTTPGRRN